MRQEPLEGLLLGSSLGPACLVSCGPVLLPWLAAAGKPVRTTAVLFAEFLAGRLAGYALFAGLAWRLGAALPADHPTRGWIFAVAHLAIALWLVAYAIPLLRRETPVCSPACVSSGIRSFVRRFGRAGPAFLGFFTGLNFCAPFMSAGVRAAESSSFAAAELFFLLFFAGTTAWLLPSIGLGWVTRFAPAVTIARMMLLILGVYYGYLGLLALGGSMVHG